VSAYQIAKAAQLRFTEALAAEGAQVGIRAWALHPGLVDTQFADEATSANVNVPVGSPGFQNRFGGWNSLREREFDHQRLKAFLKVQF